MAAGARATSPAQAARLATGLGLPVAMKLASPDFPHRSDAGLVRLGVRSAAEARRAYQELTEAARRAGAGARVEGVEVQEQVEAVAEMIVGITRDPVFGPAVLLGSGGVFAEIVADFAVRPLPLDRADAEDMLRSLKGASLLAGARGRPKGDVKALLDVVMAVARMAGACGDRLEELDLNPVVVRSKGAVSVDSLVVVRGS
jgi:succinyl-CoA synthetase beta subunit